jgi:hypothetical protein
MTQLAQYQVKGLLPVVLYDNASGSGTATSVTLAQTAANFQYLEIFFGTNSNIRGLESVRVYAPNGKYVNLSGGGKRGTLGTNNDQAYLYGDTWYISGTSFTFQHGAYLLNEGGTVGSAGGRQVSIFRVIGYPTP